MGRWWVPLASAVAAATLAGGLDAAAPTVPPSIQDSFRLGGDSGALCRVQSAVSGLAIKGMFDRAYAIVCRDAAAPTGHLYALRAGGDDPLARLATARSADVNCGATAPGKVTDLPRGRGHAMPDAERGRRLLDLLLRARRTVYVAEGLAGYDSALELGLRTMVADRIVPGDIAVATTSVADSAAFARVQAGILDPGQALAEGYRRNNAGSYAEAAKFFDSLVDRGATRNQGAQALLGEYLINRALQRSNLGLFQARGRRPGCLRGLGLVD